MLNKFPIILSLLLIIHGYPAVYASPVDDSLRFVTSSPDFVEIKRSDVIALDLRYATTNNFTGQNLYGKFDRAFLHKLTASKLAQAAANLHSHRPGYKLLILDALRPRSVQRQLWDRVKGTEQQKYVANPQSGSIHNFGFALDLTILDASGNELDMGTAFDDFTPLAQPRLENGFLKEGKINSQQLQNRLLLRKVMEDAGFIQLPIEWWHFDALPKSEVRKSNSIVE